MALVVPAVAAVSRIIVALAESGDAVGIGIQKSARTDCCCNPLGAPNQPPVTVAKEEIGIRSLASTGPQAKSLRSD